MITLVHENVDYTRKKPNGNHSKFDSKNLKKKVTDITNNELQS